MGLVAAAETDVDRSAAFKRGWLRPAVARRLIVAFSALVLLLAAAAADVVFPSLSGRVVDEAGILDQSTQTALTTKLANLEAKTTDQLVVVTLKTLQGLSIEDFGVRLGRHWQIGQKNKNNGILLIVAPGERKVRIEVGYGVEATLTDAVAKFIIEQSILPRFRASDMPGGIVRGADDIIAVLTGDAEEWKRRAAPLTPSASDPLSSFLGDSVQLVALLFFGGVFAVFFLVWGFIFFSLFVHILVVLGLLPKKKDRKGEWRWLDHFDHVGSSGSSASSSSSGGFSGGGGSFGGGGSSGSW